MYKILQKMTTWKESLFFSLFMWFIFISIIPLSIFISYSYSQSVKQLENIAKLQLNSSAKDQKIFIDNWFKNRFNDISYWSQTKNSIDFFSNLQKEYQETKNMSIFLESYNYAKILSQYDHDLVMLHKQYNYVYDFFLIDLDGNILYTTTQESDLGTNLYSGPYSSSKFAQAFKKTILTGKIYFSDLEIYPPSNNKVTGFFTAPLIDSNGDYKGVFALQIKVKYMNKSLYKGVKGIKHYLLGSDAILRSDYSSDKKALDYKVENRQSTLWKHAHSDNALKNHKEKVIDYTNIMNTTVMGMHENIHFNGIHWLLISEITHKSIFSDKDELINRLLLYLIIIVLIISSVAFYISRKITKPIYDLAQISKQFSHGRRNIKTMSHNRGEVGQLARSFNEMIVYIKDNELAILDKTDKLELALRQLDKNVIISKTDLSGIITHVSQAFCELSGYSPYELIGKTHKIIRQPDTNSDIFKELWSALQSEACWYGEIKDIRKDGSLFWLFQRIEPEYNVEGEVIGYSSIGHDITVSKHYELNLQHLVDVKTLEIKKQTDIMFQQSRMAQMGEMISMIAHQWRQPLAAISATSIDLDMQIELEIFDLEQEDNKKECQAYFRKSLKNINGFVQTLSTTIDDFRNFYRPNKVADSVPLYEPLNKALNIIRTSFATNGIEIYEPPCITCIDIRTKIYINEMMQVILNILRNSQDNFKEKQINEPKVTVECSDSNDKIILEISDNGGGIPEDVISNIFDPYFSTKDEKNGTGLGLYMSKIIVEEHHNGSLKVKNIDGGVCFTIELKVE